MLKVEKWKVALVTLVCSLSVIFALPSLLSMSGVQKNFSFLPASKMSLGLDLQGGVSLLFEADGDKYVREQYENYAEDIRAELRKAKVSFKNISSDGNGIKIDTIEGGDVGAVRYAIENLVADFNIEETTGSLQLAFKSDLLRKKKLGLIEQSIEIVRRRVDATGTVEPVIQRQGEERIILQVPGVSDPEKLKELVGKTAKMTFHLVASPEDSAGYSIQNPPPGTFYAVYENPEDKNKNSGLFIKRRVLISGENLTDAHASFDQMNRPAVTIRFDSLGARKFGEITTENVGKPFAIVLDGKIISAPVINEPIMSGSAIITGMMTVDKANELAMLLRAGALPVPLKVVEERTVGASLGMDSIEAGKIAALVSVVLILVFMVLYYSLFGLFSSICVVFNLTITVAVMALIGSTLTLPGIAGIILSLGMAVDANVLIYERIKEEVRNGKTIYSAVDSGFRRAFVTIFDSNITTLIAALILFVLGSGTVKGFAVTLAIGIVASMFTAIMMNRIMVYWWMVKKRPKVLPI